MAELLELWRALGPAWQTTALYFAFLNVIMLAMRFASLEVERRSRTTCRPWSDSLVFLFFSPVPAITTWDRARAGAVARVPWSFLRTITLVVLLAGFFALASGVAKERLPWWWTGYAVLVPFWLFVETVGTFVQRSSKSTMSTCCRGQRQGTACGEGTQRRDR